MISPSSQMGGQYKEAPIRDLLRRLREQGKTIFLSSHLLGELEQVADWLVMLHQGKALYNGPLRTFLEQYPGASFEERFLNLLKGAQP